MLKMNNSTTEQSFFCIHNKSDSNNAKIFFDILFRANIAEFKEYLRNSTYEPWEWTDDEGFTCLHKSCYLNLPEFTHHILQELKQRNYEEQWISNYINAVSQNDFTALHFASYRGNIETVETLIENGANINLRNSRGLNVIHMAAQGDQPASLIFFKEKFDMNIEEKDNLENMPLHWACYLGSENFLTFLITYLNTQNSINSQNNQGLTPLHLAVISDKSKIIKKLLHQNADLSISDKKNRTPYNLALEKNKMAVVELLEQKYYFSCKCLQRKKFEKEEKSKINFYFFIILHLFLQACVFILILPHFNSYTISIIYVSIFCFVMLFFVILKLSDPGFQGYNPINFSQENDFNLHPKKLLYDLVIRQNCIDDYCPYCIVRKNENNKIRHCFYCDRCIKEFDHHCYWVDNCVGENNINLFFCFISLVLINLFFHVYLSFDGILRKVKENNLELARKTSFPPKIKFFNDLHFYEDSARKVSSACLLIICVFFIVPVLELWIKNLKFFILRIRKPQKKENKKYEISLQSENDEEKNLIKTENEKNI